MLKESLTYDDVLIQPQFSTIKSRKEVDTSQEFCGMSLSLPVISSNMDSVTGSKMAETMLSYRAQASLHRFCSIEENVKMFQESIKNVPVYTTALYRAPFVSIGIGDKELDRAKALFEIGAKHFIIDVAHGAAIHVVEQYDKLRELIGMSGYIVVGNFDNAKSIHNFNDHVKTTLPDAFKVGIGPGSMCTTRVVTGCGGGSITALQDCATTGFPIIADGGIRNSGDMAKALAAGATVVMVGKLFAGTTQAPSELVFKFKDYDDLVEKEQEKAIINYYASNGKFPVDVVALKKYRGSASMDSYKVQGKVADHRAPEGEATLVPYTGPVKSILTTLEGGLRSSMSYVGAKNLEEFRKKAQFVRVTNNTAAESKAHGKTE